MYPLSLPLPPLLSSLQAKTAVQSERVGREEAVAAVAKLEGVISLVRQEMLEAQEAANKVREGGGCKGSGAMCGSVQCVGCRRCHFGVPPFLGLTHCGSERVLKDIFCASPHLLPPHMRTSTYRASVLSPALCRSALT